MEGIRFEPGMLVLLDVYGLQHDPRIWESPDEFRPERFSDRREDPFDFIPEGGGTPMGHRCPGEWITMHNLALALHFLTRCVRYDVPPQAPRYPLNRMPTASSVRSWLSAQREPMAASRRNCELDGLEERRKRHGLLELPKHSSQALLHARVRADDDHWSVSTFRCLTTDDEEIEPVHDRHHQIEEDHLGAQTVQQQVEGSLAVLCRMHVVTGIAERFFECVADRWIVIDDENLASQGAGALART
jgi:hypothetical protein